MLFIKKIVLKTDLNMSTKKIREYLQQLQQYLLGDERFRSLIIYYDVDPL